ncbi:MAG: ABC transporter substrate-binding protein [Chloroflexota bacterium]|nr:ABC transporter substrate-binding protein [Chloroflexota bacterium]
MTQGKNGRFLWLLPLAALVAFAAIACGGAAPAPEAPAQQPAAQAPAPAAPAQTAPTAAPAPAQEAPAAASGEGATLTVVLDNVGSPLYRNEKATWPDNMMNYYYGFQELLVTWEPNTAGDGGKGKVSDETCEAPMLALSWEYDLPPNFDDPENQGSVSVKLREGVDFYVASGRHSEFTAEDAAWSFNDAGSNNPAATHSNAGEAGDWFKLWEATDKYTLKGTFRNYIADWLNGGGAGISSMCGDAIGVVSKTLYDEIGDEILTTPHGTGPFYVQEWRPNELIEATSRVDHWNNNPNFAFLKLRQASEAAQRTALLQTGQADISMVSIQDVADLQNEGFKFHDGLNQILGQFIYMAGNYWSYKDPQTGDPVELREGFYPDDEHPWIGDPRIECADADRSNPSGALGSGCDATGFDYQDTDKFSYETEHMMKAKAFREALIYAIDRDLIGETIVSGYGGAIYGTGHGGGIAFHQTHPEYKDKWAAQFDPTIAQQKLAESGVEPGFEFEYYCPAGNGTSIEVCQAVVGMWEEHLGLKPYIDNTAYSSRRPTMVGRSIKSVWQTSWGPNSAQAKDPGGTIPVCCLWPIASAGGYNAGIEDNNFYNDFDITRIQDKGSDENLSTREEIMDRWFDLKTGTGIVEVPTLIGMNPDTVQNWDLKPWRLTNSFDTVVYQPPQ